MWPTGGQPSPSPHAPRARTAPTGRSGTAVPGQLTLSAPNAADGSCTSAPAYTAGAPHDATTDCYVAFTRSSARTGTSPITATLTWVVTLTTSDGRNEVLDAGFTSSTTEQIGVAEVQSVLR